MTTLQEAITVLSGEQQKKVILLRSFITERFPTTVKAIRLVDHEYTAAKKYKGYNLVKRDNKKLGFVYYVRYWHKGRMLASKWCTHTNSYEKACEFAERNREDIINGYLGRTGGDAVRFFKNFYDPKGKVYQNESRRNGELSDVKRNRSKAIMDDKFCRFLKERKIASFEEITVPVLDDFQDYLLVKGLKAQTVNDNMSIIKKAFAYLMRKGMIKVNPCLDLLPVPERKEEKKTHGCYEVDKLKGIFNKRWKNKLSYLLNLLIYTTDMRNCEIQRFSKKDIVTVFGVHFIDLKKSKTESGIRLVPLHPFVYRKIMNYATEKGASDAEPIIGNVCWYHFKKAYKELGTMLKVDDDFLKERNIKFYSGRHFWKTMMNAGGLGEDAEETFMGHKVSSNVAKLYNHRDMQGKKLLAKKAKDVFKILDAKVFA